MAASRGWVYFIQGLGSGMLKIGWTRRHPSERLRDIQACSPLLMEPLGAIGAIHSLERLLHEFFADARQHGEWFFCTRELMQWIDENAQPWPPEDAAPPPEPPRLREELARELHERVEFDRAIAGASREPIEPVESPLDRERREWWEAEGFPGPPQFDRMIRGVCGWVRLKDGHTAADYWAHIEQHQQITLERLRWAQVDGNFDEVFAQIMAEGEAAKESLDLARERLRELVAASQSAAITSP